MDNRNLNEAVKLLQKLIQNKCVNPPGNEIRSIETISNYLKENGIKNKIYYATKEKANLIAKIKGTGGKPSLMFGPSHVDVVPVEDPENWEVPPFSGEIKNGYVWGRGSFDMLFIVAAQCQAFVQLFREGFKPKGDLVLSIVSDEETGSSLGAKWMTENYPEEMKVDYATSEFGGFQLEEGKYIFVYGERGGVWLRISFIGESNLASMPFGVENVSLKAAEAAYRLSDYKPPIITKYLKSLAEGLELGFFQKLLLTKKRLIPFALKQLLKSDPALAKALHSFCQMTITPTIIKSGNRINVIPAKSYIEVDIRILPNQDYDYVLYHIKKALGKELAQQATIEILENEGGMVTGTESSINNDFSKATLKIFQKFHPGCSLVPVLSYGLTDLRFIRNLGGNGYGYSFYSPDTPTEEVTGAGHSTNERIRIDSVDYTIKAYYELAKELLS